MVMQIFVQVTCSMYDATYKPQPSSSPGDVTSWVGISVWAWPGVTKFTQNPVMLHHPTDNHRITYYFSDLVLCFCSLWHSHGPRWGLSLSLSVFLVELQNNFTVPVQTPTHKSRNQDLIIQKKKKKKIFHLYAFVSLCFHFKNRKAIQKSQQLILLHANVIFHVNW